MHRQKIRRLSYTAMLTALICMATLFFRIPTVLGYANLGDGMILLGAFLLGPFYGAVAGGVGSALADLWSGYAIYAPGSLIIKGGIALLAGLILRKLPDRLWPRLLAMVLAEAWMVLGYWGYETLLIRQPVAALAVIPSNIAQGVVGTALGMVLYSVLKKLPLWKKVTHDV